MKAYKRNRGSLPSFREVLRSSGVVTLAFLAAFLVGCSDDTLPPVGPSGVTNGTLPPPPPPSAVISVEVLDFGGLATGQGNLFFVEFKMTESAGVGANINFVRLEVFRATGELEERQEIGAGQMSGYLTESCCKLVVKCRERVFKGLLPSLFWFGKRYILSSEVKS